MSFVIRPETPADMEAIHRIEAAAFEGEAHAVLVNRLRADGALLLSHVAVCNDEIVGHAAYSLLTITDGGRVEHCPALGPIAVDPPYQGRGIGSALARAGLGAMRDMGYGLLFLVGSPRYYPRFGFQPAQPLGFTSDYVAPGGPHEHFMVAVLDERAAGGFCGHTRFHPAFAEAEAS
ncbi:MAG: N-acetyltransferase [Chloroflexi bacterium]|nr:N-acetyltransferase [Chloroflexota bacterium]